MDNKGADQTARMRRLVCAFIVRIPPKTGFLATMPICNEQYATATFKVYYVKLHNTDNAVFILDLTNPIESDSHKHSLYIVKLRVQMRVSIANSGHLLFENYCFNKNHIAPRNTLVNAYVDLVVFTRIASTS